ncbi:MAG: acylphosphatase [Burkholderiaceae bacterium]
MSADVESVAVSVVVHGRVQGVGYRAWFQRNALALDLRGWVRNRGDGTVEAELHGARDAVFDMISRATRGPPAARVERVAHAPVAPSGAPPPGAFIVRPGG